MAGEAEKEYVLGTHEAERMRLGLQHRLWSEAAFACWERAGIGPGQAVLDVGCGPGYTSQDLAQLVAPGGRVLALDVSERFVEHLQGLDVPGIKARVADVQRIVLPEGSFDAAYTRWVLCFVPDPEAVIAGVARTLRRSGVFAIQEYVNYRGILLAPGSLAFRRGIDAVHESWLRHGGDPDVGMRIPELLVRHGFQIQEIRPMVRIARPGSPLWQWPTTFFRNNLPLLAKNGFLTDEEVRAFQRDWAAHSENPAAFFSTPPMVEIIARKG